MADKLIRATAAQGGIRAVGTITTQLTAQAQQRHALSYVATAALGRAMSAGLLLASNMKQPEARVNLRIKGSGPLGGLLVDAGPDGTVRGYVDNPAIELPPNAQGKLDVSGAIGRPGYLYVVRDVGYGYPYASTVELVSGEVGEDITYYLTHSEQTPSALSVGVFVSAEGVIASGGILLQVLPQAARDKTLVQTLESRVAELSSFSGLLRAGRSLNDILEALLGEWDLTILPEVQMVRFHCGCNFERFLRALKMLGRDKLQDMIDKNEGAEATCHFCGSVFHASNDRLAGLIAELQAESG